MYRRMRICLFIVALMTIVFVGISQALVITSPHDGDAFKEGDTVKLVAELSPNSQEDQKIGYVSFNVTKGIDHCPSEIATHPHYECSFIIPSASPRVIKINAEGVTADGVIDSQWITIYVSLSPTVTLQGLKLFTGNRLFFSRLTQKRQIYVTGAYSDGVERDLWLASTGTTYTSSNEKIVTVNADGLATAVASGNAQITVNNGDKKLVIDVVVKPK